MFDSDDVHAWWAQRDHLDTVVNPKKRGAAARRAEGSLEPPLTRRRPSHSDDLPPETTWDPTDTFAWRIPGGPRAHLDAQATAASAPPPADAPPAAPTPWDVLGLTVDATWAEVSRRHKQLAKVHHPDRHGQDDVAGRRQAEQNMAEVNAAFSELGRIYRMLES